MDIVIFGLTAAGLHIAIDIVLLCVYAARNRKNKKADKPTANQEDK